MATGWFWSQPWDVQLGAFKTLAARAGRELAREADDADANPLRVEAHQQRARALELGREHRVAGVGVLGVGHAGLERGLRLADLAVFAPMWWQLVAVVSILFAVQCLQHVRKNLLVVFEWPFLARWGFYTLLFHTLVLFGSPGGKAFIYFQF